MRIETKLLGKNSSRLARYLIWIFIVASVLGATFFATLNNHRFMSRVYNWWNEQNDPYLAKAHKLLRESGREYGLDPTTAPENRLFEAGRRLQQEYPARVTGYGFMMGAIEHSELKNHPAEAKAMAVELINSSAPEDFKLWAKGFLYRLDSRGNPVAIKFTAVDGREVDMGKLSGKVVLVDFWATECVPCVAALPRVKAALEKYRQKGLEVIGISCDTDKEKLQRFLKAKEISWPQYFDGQQQAQNKFAQSFGICGVPHMFLVDKKGCLRFDNVWAAGGRTNFEDKIEILLAEP